MLRIEKRGFGVVTSVGEAPQYAMALSRNSARERAEFELDSLTYRVCGEKEGHLQPRDANSTQSTAARRHHFRAAPTVLHISSPGQRCRAELRPLHAIEAGPATKGTGTQSEKKSLSSKCKDMYPGTRYPGTRVPGYTLGQAP
eukprot:2920059-Rhodomonas_salina.1